MLPQVTQGLNPLPRDDRDLPLGGISDLPALSTLSKTFSLGHCPVLNQGADGLDDFCTAYSTTIGSYFQDGVLLYPPYVFAASKELTKDPESWGQDLRSLMKAWTRYGCPEDAQIPDAVRELPPKQKRYFANYPAGLYTDAKLYIKKSYLFVTGPYDFYDNIRASLFKYKNPVYFGAMFSWSLSSYILDGTAQGPGHAMVIVGWDEDGLDVVNSYGINAGIQGHHRITRKTINHFANIYGIYMMTDIPREEAERLIKENLKAQITLLQRIIALYEQLKRIIIKAGGGA